MNTEITEELKKINDRISNLETLINSKMDPLLDLLQMVIKNKLNTGEEPVNSPIPDREVPNLVYRELGENVYISGKKTYDSRHLIKETFKGSAWDNEKKAWSFKKFENYEEILKSVFPDIVKD